MEKLTVLIVDDIKMSRIILRKNLISIGFLSENIYECSNGEEALSFLGENQSVDVVISDLMMPGIGGLDLIERVRERKASGPAILIASAEEKFEIIKNLLELEHQILDQKCLRLATL